LASTTESVAMVSHPFSFELVVIHQRTLFARLTRTFCPWW
jgi:hypothetical protein